MEGNTTHLDQRELWDISPRISSRLAVFPGDTAFERQVLLDLERGNNITLSTIRATVHLGAHADAPNHYHEAGSGIEGRDLRLYLGPAQVIEVEGRRGERLRPDDLGGVSIRAPRILFKTGTFPDPEQWNADFMALSADLVNWLADQGVRLVGIDTPSIDPAADAELESHGAVARRDMAILEGLVLERVPPGVYELIALPLPLEGLDASPVRAILVR